jgi:alpha-2-macroglobulin
MRRFAFALITIVVVAFAGFSLARSAADGKGRQPMFEKAEQLAAEGSYRLALEEYAKLESSSMSVDERRWLDFRKADLAWRAAPEGPDDTIVAEASRKLVAMLVDDRGRAIDDSVRPEILESLGDLEWTTSRRNLGSAWNHYRQALDWWAGARDVETARRRYIAIVRKASQTRPEETWYPRGYYASSIPFDVLENAAKIARDPDDVAYMNYLVAMQLMNRGDAREVEKTRRSFETALAARSAEWRDDALFHMGQWLERSGRIEYSDEAGFSIEPDYNGAVDAYRSLLSEYPKGRSRWHDQAAERLRAITEPSLGLAVSNVFLPGSKIDFQISWRNLESAELSLTRVDLTEAIRFKDENVSAWLAAIDPRGGRDRSTWTRQLPAKQRLAPGSERVVLDKDLAPGAWLLEARRGDASARELILVSDMAVVTRSSGQRTLAWVVDARSGEPIPGAKVRAWFGRWDSGRQSVIDRSASTDTDGIAEIDLVEGASGPALVTAAKGDRQAFAPFYTGYGRGDRREQWKIYAVTDRPAYRPDETVNWKITARMASDKDYSIPSGRELRYTITDPRGTEVSKGELRLNSFGSAWSELELTSEMTLGVYGIAFALPDGRSIGSAQLFRLEEYKLPEFRVSVSTADGEGNPRLYRPGDRVEASIEASYYFGGPVANATVAVVVRRQPYYRWWVPRRDFPWYFAETRRPGWYGGEGQIVKQENLTTDARGRATISFDSPLNEGQDLEYTIEARVTDASRREITGNSRVRVTRAPFFADLRPAHYIYQPRDKVEVALRTVDANDQPTVTTGTIRVTREVWEEIWLDPKGREVTGRELEELKARVPSFPPPQEPGQHAWALRKRGYEQEEVAKATVRTDADGEATYSFTPEREGFYRFSWSGRPEAIEKPRPWDVVAAESTVWVATNASTRIGYHREGGIEIILDEESVRPGATVPVMLVAPAGGRNVLLGTETADILDRQVVRMKGDVRLVQLTFGERHMPNVFLTATMVSDLQLHIDTKEVIVPPVSKFLTVTITPDREEYQPREKGTLTVSTKDADGNPVSAEVSLGLADESVYAIGEDLAADPRQFFYGEKRYHGVQTASSFNFRSYRKALEADGTGNEVVAPGARRDLGRAQAAEMLAAPAPAMAMEGAVADMAAAAPMAKSAGRQENDVMVAGGEQAGTIEVRSDFRSTVLWLPDIVTGSDGTATVEATYPDSLTSWRATARANSVANQFGVATSTTRTKKPLIVRLQAPRFFVVGDQTVVSAVVNNNTEQSLEVASTIDVAGLVVSGLWVDGKPAKGEAGPVRIDAGAEGRVDWVVSVREPGQARIRVAARAGALSDAMEKTYPVEDHGIEKLVAVGGRMRGAEGTLTLDIPAARRKDSTMLSIQVAPSLAVTMLDALPYLIDYPYGCTEQTMSRFLPTVVVAKALADLGVPRQAVASRLFGGIEPDSAQATHKGDPRDLAKMDDMISKGLARLYDFQHGDGGWGWWKEGSSDPWMSAYVVWGLALARDAGVDVRANALDRGVSFLDTKLVEAENSPDLQAWMLHARTAARKAPSGLSTKAVDNLWMKKERLTSYGRALFALALHQSGDAERAKVLARNLENAVVVDQAPDKSFLVKGSGSGSSMVMGTAFWGQRGFWWRWHEGPIESTAFALRALAAIDPNHRLVEPSMNWLVKNRRGAQWSNTRDTAIAVLALNEYLKRTGELGSDVEYEVVVNGTSIAKRSIPRADLVAAPSLFSVDRANVRDGKNEIVVRQTKGGALYVSAEARFFSLEEPVTAAGNEIFVKREYYKLVPRPTLLKGYVHDPVPLRDGESVVSGQRVEVVVTVETKNDYEYLILEDLKPAGLEAVELVSGQPLYARRIRTSQAEERMETREAGRVAPTVAPPDSDTIGSAWVYRELRDRKVAMFIDRLEQGVWEIRYQLRAEVPGTFHALPLIGQAMYVPEIRGNSAEVRMTVEERE